ncbi:MAG: hypothetical protein HYX71_05760 [Opitutae bacterium]|nr:hypothetical protein [Opitutae bacterium]
MKQNILLKHLSISAAAVLGLAALARADTPPSAPAPAAPARSGLLGERYATLSYSYAHLADSPVNADSYRFAFNEPLNPGFDAVFAYDWSQTRLFAGSRLNVQSLTGGVRAFSNNFAWGKPYVEAGLGYAWQRGFGGQDRSILWGVAAGAELQVARAVTVTPFVEYADAPDLAGSGAWTYGVKANYWVDGQWAVTAGLDRDDDQNTSFTIGTNFRF